MAKTVYKSLAVLLVIAVPIAGLVVYSNEKRQDRLLEAVSMVSTLIEQDQLDEALTLLVKDVDGLGSESVYQEMVTRVKTLIQSRGAYATGQQALIAKKYEDAIRALSEVDPSDQERYESAQAGLLLATGKAVEEAISAANGLKNQRKYELALRRLEGVRLWAGQNQVYASLKASLVVLIEAEKKRKKAAEEAALRSSLRAMRIEKDNFNGITFYTDRTTPYYANYSTFHLYIGKKKGEDPYLRFKVRYSDDDWLFVSSASVNVDGEVYDLDVYDWDRDNGSGDIWEWFDVVPTDDHLDLVNKIIKSRSATIRFFGDQYRDDRTISSTEKRALKNVLNALKALERGL